MRVNKLICLIMALMLACSLFFACGKNNGNNSGDSGSENNSESVKEEKPNEAVADETEHYATANRLHNVNVDYSSPVSTFVMAGKTDYKIVTTDEYVVAAKFIAKNVFEATGVQIDVDYSGNANAANGKYIFLGLDEKSEAAGIAIPSKETLGTAGYSIKTVGDDVYIDFYSAAGAQMGAIAFLRAVLGYDMLAEDLIVYEKDGGTMPKMDIEERPDYEYRIANNRMSEDAKYGYGFTTQVTMLRNDYGDVHNMFGFFDESDLTENPKWFSNGATWDKNNPLGQPCFTAHGDKVAYEAMVERVKTRILEYVAANKDVMNVRISPNDVTHVNSIGKCICAACTASYAHYGDTLGGAILSFANDLSEKIQAELAVTENENLKGRTVNLVVLAYGQNIDAPVEKDGARYVFDENGKGIPVTRYDFNEKGEATPVKDENGNEVKLVCADGVNIEYAPSAANWIHSFYEDQNSGYAASLQAWSGLGGNLYVWAYEISYYQYLYPYNNYSIMVENIRYFKNNNGNYIYPQGTYENQNNSAFTKFREYINSHALFDVNVNYKDLRDKYFKYYFGAAGEKMLDYFDSVQMNLKLNENITGGATHSFNLSRKEVWPEEVINGYMNLINEAYEAIEEAKVVDDKNYGVYKQHILIESLFPRFVLCTTYAENQSKSDLVEMRKQFVTDYYALGNVSHQETINITEIFVKEWGIS